MGDQRGAWGHLVRPAELEDQAAQAGEVGQGLGGEVAVQVKDCGVQHRQSAIGVAEAPCRQAPQA